MVRYALRSQITYYSGLIMAGGVTPKKVLEQAVILREGGYSLTSIATKLNTSVSTLSRHFKRHGIAKGSLSEMAVAEAKQQLLNDAGFIDSLKQQIASSITDDLAQVERLRQASALTLEQLMADKSLPAHYRARGIAALSTGIKLTQEVARRALRVDTLEPEKEDLPELTITELTADDVEQMRAAQVNERIEIGEEINEVVSHQ